MAFNRAVNQANIDMERKGTYSVIPVGEYRVQIVQSTDAISQSSGKDMIKLELEILDGQFKGRKIWQNIVDNQYADQTVYEIYRSCGLQIPKSINSAMFRNLVGKIKTKIREYNGSQNAEVNYWVKPKSGEVPASAPAPVQSAAPANEDPDDIPF